MVSLSPPREIAFLTASSKSIDSRKAIMFQVQKLEKIHQNNSLVLSGQEFDRVMKETCTNFLLYFFFAASSVS